MFGWVYTGGLIILDEPTDGFSSQQLYRMREVLKDLNCEQVILVSHESELEGLANHVFRVDKVAGESIVSTAVIV